MSEKKLALVTGASRGIGRAIARELYKKGFLVGIHYHTSQKEAETLKEELGEGLLIQADISTIEGCDKIYDEIKNSKLTLEVLVNNAGFVKDNPIFNASLEEFDKIISTNMRSVWYLTKRLVRFMIRNRSGRIINISSIIGSTGNPTQSIYGMTKAAIDNFTKTAAMEFAEYGILVNSIAPGFIDTDMTKDLPEEHKKKILEKIPLGRMGKPEEIAEVVGFLATSGSYITGTVIHVNGGMYGG
ncbi:MAG: 3-oxoacyl-ACP reductase FabG [Leptospiraceae bacterium]|nr:3-oxoacyl-ACP reductase FabG [Leptospiraceae bacterium]MDW7975374.1 3-oxoacyl-ACP reductase family protein [Leptospiraceae bacterium]